MSVKASDGRTHLVCATLLARPLVQCEHMQGFAAAYTLHLNGLSSTNVALKIHLNRHTSVNAVVQAPAQCAIALLFAYK
jgi:hypothetical protein